MSSHNPRHLAYAFLAGASVAAIVIGSAAGVRQPSPAPPLPLDDARTFLEQARPLTNNSTDAYVFMFADGKVHVSVKIGDREYTATGISVEDATQSLLAKNDVFKGAFETMKQPAPHWKHPRVGGDLGPVCR